MLFLTMKTLKKQKIFIKFTNHFALDFNSLKRIGSLGKEIENIKTLIIMIDYHESPEKFSNLFYLNQILDPLAK